MSLYIPRPYQKRAIDSWFENCDEYESQLMVLPTGSGKTLLFFHIIARTGGLCVVVVPLLAILDDLRQSYIESVEFKNYSKLYVCSNAHGTTDSEEIEDFLMNDSDNKLVLVTYDSLGTFLDCVDATETFIDIMVYDEAHHTVENSVIDLIYPVDETHGYQKLFITATPRTDRVNGIMMYNRDTDDAVIDMLESYSDDYGGVHYDVETDCGVVSFEYLFSEAVSDGWINDFEVILERIEVPKTFYTKHDIFRYLLRAVMLTHNTRVLGFTQYALSEKEGKNFVEGMLSRESQAAAQQVFRELGGGPQGEFKRLTLLGITGGGSAESRQRILKEFEEGRDDEITILFNCNVVGEGVDTKTCNAVCFIDTRTGTISVSQNIGRCTRKLTENQPKSSVIVPVAIDSTVLDGVEDKKERDRILREQLVGCDSFLNVISALKQSDPVSWLICLRYPKTFAPYEIRDKFRKSGYRIGDGCKGIAEAVNKVLETEGNKTVLGDVLSVQDMARELGRPIEVHGVNRQAEKEVYGECYKGEPIYIHHDAEQKYRPVIKVDRKAPGGRVKNIKRGHRTSKIHNNDELMVLFDLEDADTDEKFYRGLKGRLINKNKWIDNYELLITWINNHNNMYPRQTIYKKDIPQDEIKLGRWCNKQRNAYKNNLLDKNKINLLEKLQEWQWDKNLHELWLQRFAYIKTYIDKTNNYPSQIDDDKIIKFHGKWLTQQKVDYTKSKLELYKILKLESLPYWTWKLLDYKWDKIYHNYKNFISNNNRNPYGYNVNNNEITLYRWGSRQKVLYKKNKLAANRSQLLNRLHGWQWDVDYDEKWTENFMFVKKFIDENDRYPKEGENCYRWIDTQKNRYLNGKLSNVRIEKLCSLKNWYWNNFDKKWQQKYKEIIKLDHKPATTNKLLYDWYSTQQKKYRDKKLSSKQINLLNNIKWWKWYDKTPKTLPAKNNISDFPSTTPPKCANKTLTIHKKSPTAEPKVVTVTVTKKLPVTQQAGIYNGTKSTDKERCNQYFARECPVDTPIIILDGDQLYTTNTLIEHGIPRENIYIPQYEEQTFSAQLSVHPNTFHATLNEFLVARAGGSKHFGAVWFDYTCTFPGNERHCRPILDVEIYFANKMAASQGVFALTWTNTRMAENEPFCNPSEVKNWVIQCARGNGYELTELRYLSYTNNMAPMHFVIYKVNSGIIIPD